LACNALSGGDAPSQPEQPVQEQPAQPDAPIVTEAPAVTVAPTEAPVSNGQQFFTEEFDSPLSSDWETLTVTGSDKADADKVTVEPKDGRLIWDFESEYVYYYLFYTAFEYEDVRIDVRADNRGKNNNSISLICRYDPEVGWYEFNIANNGLYNIIYAEVNSNGKIGYKTITDGGSNDIKQGKDVNEYGISCKGDELTLYINGEEVKSLPERKYSLQSGRVGVSVSSFNVVPILIEMDWIKISEP
jgi:hypothetical protein